MRVVVRVFAPRVAVRMRVLRPIGMHVLVFVRLVVVIVLGVRVAVRVRVFGSVGVGMLVGVIGRLHNAYVHRLCRALPRNEPHRFGALAFVRQLGFVVS